MKDSVKKFLHTTRQTVVVTVVLMLICGLLFPLLLTGLSSLLFPHQANGSMIAIGGKIVGAEHVGQEFTEDYYMWSRPSAYHYNVYTEDEEGKQYYSDGTEFPGIGSGSNNYAPTNPALLERVEKDIVNYVARTLGVDTAKLPDEAELLGAQMDYIAKKAGISTNQLKEKATAIPEEGGQVLAYLAESAGLATGEKEMEALAASAPTLYQLQKDYISEAAGISSEEVEKIIAALPTDLMTASGSGLDPHISPKSAEIQIPRIAEASGLSEGKVQEIIKNNTSGKFLGIFGEETVNVLKVNIEIAQNMSTFS